MTCSLISETYNFQNIYKSAIEQCFLNLKIGKRSFLNSVFKHPKMSNVTQTLLKRHHYQMRYFFATTVFSV